MNIDARTQAAIYTLQGWADSCRYYAKRAEGRDDQTTEERRAEYRGQYRAYDRAIILLKTGK